MPHIPDFPKLKLTESKKATHLRDRLALLMLKGLDLHQQGKFNKARTIYGQVLASQPDHFDSLQLLGALLVQTNQFTEAVDYLNKASQINPNHATCFSNRGIALQELGRIDEALASYDKAISINPNYAEAYFNKGNILQVLRLVDEAIASYDKAISIDSNYIKAYCNQGYALQGLGRLDEALASYDKAISINPNYAEAYFNKGNVLQVLGLVDEAIASYDKAISINPNYAEAYFNKGNILQVLGLVDEAIASYDKAISINPNYAEAQYNRGISFERLGSLDNALASYDNAISINPDYVEAHSNRGNVLQEFGRLDEAHVSYSKAITINPNYSEAHWNLSLSLLLNGNFKDGWKEYEWRWKTKNFQVRDFEQPLWLGVESLKDKKILLYAEQGLGDTIQFCRYVPLVAQLGAQVILEVQPALVNLLRSLEGVHQIIQRGNLIPDFDYQCPLLSLPLAFHADLNNIPTKVPYVKTIPTKEKYWKEKLNIHNKLKIGLVWNGGFRPNQPEVWGINARRNIPLTKIANINIPEFDFISLQKGEPAESELSQTGNQYWKTNNFYNYVNELEDFSDTAALIANLDLIISVDTSTAHLSAAMGKPTWLLNRFDPCWRWLLSRNDSIWYPTLKLYRQEKMGDWDGVIQKVKLDLIKLLNSVN